MRSRNELLALGGGVYLELIGPDPDQPDPDRPRPFGIDDLDEPRLASFAVGEGPAAFDATMRRLRDAGFETEERQMTRTREDGMVLSWRLARIVDDVSGGRGAVLDRLG